MWFRSFVKSLDLFGYTPAFRIAGNDKLKSFSSGLSTLIFLLISIGYFGYSVSNYLTNIDRVMTSRVASEKSQKYNLSLLDLCYGIGILDHHEKILNMSEFDYIEAKANFVFLNRTTNKVISYPLELVPCTPKDFIPDIDFITHSISAQNYLNKTIPYYLCPNSNSKFFLAPNDYTADKYTLEFSLSLKNDANMSYASYNISNFRPIFSLLYQDFIINSDNKTKPYTQKIGEYQNQIGFLFSKTTILKVFPSNILDDTNPIGSGEYVPVKVKDYTTQQDSAIFSSVRGADYFRYLINREEINYDDKNLITIEVHLGSNISTTYRTYRKFNDFVASVSSIISSVLIVFTFILAKVNSIKGLNSMVKSLFNLEKIHEIKDLKIKLQSVINDYSKNFNKQEKKKMRRSTNFQTRAKFLAQSLKINEIEDTDHQKSFNEIQLTRKRTIKINDLEEIISELRFNFAGYLKLKFLCIKEKKMKEIFEIAIQNLDNMMDINHYLRFKFEMEMIKDIIFDKYQKATFDLVSNLLSFNTLFSDQNSKILRNNSCTSNYDLNQTKKIIKRRNEMDKKIIFFINDIMES